MESPRLDSRCSRQVKKTKNYVWRISNANNVADNDIQSQHHCCRCCAFQRVESPISFHQISDTHHGLFATRHEVGIYREEDDISCFYRHPYVHTPEINYDFSQCLRKKNKVHSSGSLADLPVSAEPRIMASSMKSFI